MQPHLKIQRNRKSFDLPSPLPHHRRPQSAVQINREKVLEEHRRRRKSLCCVMQPATTESPTLSPFSPNDPSPTNEPIPPTPGKLLLTFIAQPDF
ncbi:hypothetical protein NPIL_561121 [Nephila pilipes]|uniref:Uncharacterized protein n=1 Tax=Nephila pilipes TaxID=299642 RepID=A0A8X6N968_NEPPI|nr:hypothetical protein NPIL_558221 [Nephila pilipes]GFU43579.1 hypothetical protein NPIL_561121 [Nephila pilipes]